MVSPSVAEAVGGRIGVVKEVEKQQKQDISNFFMRVKVALPLSKPLWKGAFLADSNGQKSWVMFKYERLALFCHYCSLLGHDLRHCAQYFGATKNGEEVECQYGDQLKDDGAGRAAVARVSMATQVDGTAENQGSCLEFSQLNFVFQGEKASAMEGMDGPIVGDDDQSPGMAGLGVFMGPLI